MNAGNAGKTAKSKLDAALGITGGASIDDFLESLTMENDSVKDAVGKIDKEIKGEISSIDEKALSIAGMSDIGQQALSLAEIKTSLKNIDDLIAISKEIIKHIYESIVSTELVDSETVQAAASLIESCHLNIREYIDLYKDRLKSCDRIQLEIMKHQHNLEILEKKHQYDLEKASKGAIDIPEGGVSWDQTKVVDILKRTES